MAKSAHTTSLVLDGEHLDELSAWLEDVQEREGIDRQNRIRTRLMVENLLLIMRDHLGEDKRATVSVDRGLGRLRLRLALSGEPFNPLSGADSGLGEWESSLGAAIGLTPQYGYEHNTNVLRLAIPFPRMNPVMRIGIAILIGVAVGLIGDIFVPEDANIIIQDLILDPIYDVWNRVLNAISGPIVFLTVITTMLNAQRIDEQGGSKVFVVVRYFALSILVVMFCLLMAATLFPLVHADLSPSLKLVRGVIDSIVANVPSNVVEPFIQSNTSQLLFLAFGLGIALTELEGRVESLTRVIREANVLGLRIARWVSELVPYITGIFICLELLQGRTVLLQNIWLPIVVAFALSVATLVVTLIVQAHLHGLSPLTLARKLWPPFAVALRSGSLDESFAETQSSCTHRLGIDPDYVKVGLPQGLVLYMPVSAIGTVIFTLFVAREYGVESNALWFITAIVMAVVVFVATPPVPGANLLAYVVLFATLGIPEEALLDAMIFDVVFGIFAGAANQAMLQLEMLSQARRFGLLDLDRLRRP